jgi:transcriptional regulator with XRE-family HTH domain
MELRHPFDEELRARLKAARPNQSDFGRAIGRSAGWVNKYMHGAGNATIDDAIRIAALLNGLEHASTLSESERRLLKAYRGIPDDRQEDAVVVFENVARGYRRVPPSESTAPTARTHPATARTKRGTR